MSAAIQPMALDSRWKAIQAILICATVIALIEIAQAVFQYQIRNPIAILLTLVGYAAWRAGIKAALVVVSIIAMYGWVSLAEPGNPFHYTAEHLRQAWLLTITAPVLAALISVLKHEAVTTADQLARQTEREVARKNIEEERARLAALVQQLPVGVLLFDAHRKLQLSNDRAADLLGKNPGIFDDPSIDRLFHLDGKPYRPTEMPVVRALAGETIRDEDMYFQPDTGGPMVRLRVSAAPVQSGESVGTAVLTIANAPRPSAAEHAAAELDLVRALSSDGFLTLTPSGTILTCNDAAERIFGRAADDIQGKALRDLLPEAQHFDAARGAVFASGAVQVSVAPITAKDGEVLGAIAVARR